jgi:hypothetical protein
MKLSDQLNKDTKDRLKKMKRRVSNDPLQEKLSERELKDLMGMNRDTYVRRGGAIRRK